MSTRSFAIIAALLMWGSVAHAQTAVQITGGGKTATVKTGTTSATSDNALVVVDPATLAAQTTGNGSLATIATNTSSPVPAGTNIIGFTSNDPCTNGTKSNVAVSQITSTQIIVGTSAKKTYICSIALIAGAAEIVNLIAGTGTVCATGSSAVMGSTTAANGMSLAANGGLTMGGGGTVALASNAAADNVCLSQSTTSRVSGVITYVQQ